MVGVEVLWVLRIATGVMVGYFVGRLLYDRFKSGG